MSTKYTPAAIHQAFYAAAAHIEREPGCYDYGQLRVPTCGSPGCMWGWIGFELGLAAGTINARVAESCGMPSTSPLYSFAADKFTQAFVKNEPAGIAQALRAFADHKWPQTKPQTKQLDPAFLRLRASLPSLAAQMRAEGKWQLAAVIEGDAS